MRAMDMRQSMQDRRQAIPPEGTNLLLGCGRGRFLHVVVQRS